MCRSTGSAPAASVFASVLTAVDAVGDHGRGTDDGSSSGDGGADDGTAGSTSGTERHVKLLR